MFVCLFNIIILLHHSETSPSLFIMNIEQDHLSCAKRSFVAFNLLAFVFAGDFILYNKFFCVNVQTFMGIFFLLIFSLWMLNVPS